MHLYAVELPGVHGMGGAWSTPPPSGCGLDGDSHDFAGVQRRLSSSGLAPKQCVLLMGVDFSQSNADDDASAAAPAAASRRAIEPSIIEDYVRAIRAVGSSLCPFIRENAIQCYGFGDAAVCTPSAAENAIFSFGNDRGDDEAAGFSAPRRRRDLQLTGFEGVLRRYRRIAPYVQLGPEAASIAPIVRRAADLMVAESSGGGRVHFHVLVLLTAGPVQGRSEEEEESTRAWEDDVVAVLADVSRRRLPLSIIVVMVSNLASHALGSAAHTLRATREEAAWACIQRAQIRVAEEVPTTMFSPPIQFVRASPRPDVQSLAADALRQLPEHYKTYARSSSSDSEEVLRGEVSSSVRDAIATRPPVVLVPRPPLPSAQERAERSTAWLGWRTAASAVAPIPSAPPAPSP